VTQIVRDEVVDDPTVDITTTGRRSGERRRIEIWMLDIDGRFFITGTPGRRDWLANLAADPRLVVHLKRRAHADLQATATPLTDESIRRFVLEHPSAHWYRGQRPSTSWLRPRRWSSSRSRTHPGSGSAMSYASGRRRIR